VKIETAASFIVQPVPPEPPIIDPNDTRLVVTRNCMERILAAYALPLRVEQVMWDPASSSVLEVRCARLLEPEQVLITLTGLRVTNLLPLDPPTEKPQVYFQSAAVIGDGLFEVIERIHDIPPVRKALSVRWGLQI
jgi:hypothetical protein